MAYSTSTPPVLIIEGGINGKAANIWSYFTTDASTVVDTLNYFTNGGSLGMKVGDIVFVINSSTFATQIMIVSATGDGTTNLTDGLAVAAANTD